MKPIFHYFVPVLLLAALASCDFEPYKINLLSNDISVSTQEITLESTGNVPGTFDIQSSGDWLIVAPEGLTVSPKYGNGPATITVSAPDNIDDVWHEVQGPRSFKLSVCGTETTIPVVVNQKGEAGLDASRTYTKITKAEDFESGMGYLIVAADANGAWQACGQVPASRNYGWPSLVAIEGDGPCADFHRYRRFLPDPSGGWPLLVPDRYLYEFQCDGGSGDGWLPVQAHFRVGRYRAHRQHRDGEDAPGFDEGQRGLL